MAKKNVAILTNFQEFNPGYSLCCIVIDQAHMLARNGHTVLIFVNERFNPKHNKNSGLEDVIAKYPDKIFILKRTKFMHLKDYQTKADLSEEHKAQATEAGQELAKDLVANNCTIVFTHDFVFTGWNLPYAIAVQHAQATIKEKQRESKWQDMRWYHWIHSVPSADRDWWCISSYIGFNYIVYPNKIEIARVAESYKTSPNSVCIIPHIKDIRTWYDFGSEACEFIDRYPQLLQSRIVQVYPCSSDRLSAKRLHTVIRLFGYMKEAKSEVFLLVANQWATGRQNEESIDRYMELAQLSGLEYGEDFAFTSEYIGHKTTEYLYDRVKMANSLGEFMEIFGSADMEQLMEAGIGAMWDMDLRELNDDTYEKKKPELLQNMKPYRYGINRRMLRELQLLSSLFIFPTREESFGLVGPEASYSGALVIANRSLSMMFEVLGTATPSFDFGSYHQNHPPVNSEDYLRAVASAILNRFYSNEAVMTKAFCRCRYNMDSIYDRYYLPVLF